MTAQYIQLYIELHVIKHHISAHLIEIPTFAMEYSDIFFISSSLCSSAKRCWKKKTVVYLRTSSCSTPYLENLDYQHVTT